MIDLFLLGVDLQGVQARFLLNDVPIRTHATDKSLETADPVNQWIVPGKNRLRVDVLKAPSPQGRLLVWMRRQPQDGSSGPVELARMPIDLSNIADATLPVTEETSFLVDSPPPTRLWPALSRIRLDDNERDRVFRLLGELNTALANRDIDTVARLLRIKGLEMAYAYGLVEQVAIQQQRTFFEELMQEPGWGMLPLVEKGLQYHLVHDGRILWVTRAGEAPALQSNGAGGLTFSLPIYLAPINGRWTIVR